MKSNNVVSLKGEPVNLDDLKCYPLNNDHTDYFGEEVDEVQAPPAKPGLTRRQKLIIAVLAAGVALALARLGISVVAVAWEIDAMRIEAGF